ncbi:FHA domain-containing protein [Christensenellaceae bacterium OttesenSCG-928-M15]|nr:FHA domain-containing protein [Christensenellaceae bacterium OttesenSCG-928-M15]
MIGELGSVLARVTSVLDSLGVMLIVIIIGVLGCMYALDGFQWLTLGRKAGLDKDWMPFVPFAHAIYRLNIIGEQWWKMFFLEMWWLYAFIMYKIVMAISTNKWATFAIILVTIYLAACLAYNIYYRYKYYKAFQVKPVLCLLLPTFWLIPCVRVIDLMMAFTNNFEFTGEGTSRTIKGTLKAAVSIPKNNNQYAQQNAQTGSITGLSGMYAGQDLPIAANEELVIGRDNAFCNLIVDQHADKVSRKHCSVTYDASRRVYMVTDYSTNGTFVDGGNRLVANMPTMLQRGTVIALGSRENRFKLN